MDKNTNEYTPNVALIREKGIRLVRGTIPRAVRNELMNAVKAGSLAWLKKDRLKPDIFCHPDHKNEAIQHQFNEALHAIKCISKVVTDSNGM